LAAASSPCPERVRYLDSLRQRRPAVLADILPDLTGVALVLDAAPDFVDPSRINLRAAIENGRLNPAAIEICHEIGWSRNRATDGRARHRGGECYT
jgi:hypothetical protein